MIIMDTKESNNNLYELHIPLKHSIYVCDLFDDEMDKRMSLVEKTKRQIIETDLDNLVVVQENLLKIKIQKEGLKRDEISLQYRVFNKTEDLKTYWEEKLGVDFDESMEVWHGFDFDNEILDIEKLKEHV